MRTLLTEAKRLNLVNANRAKAIQQTLDSINVMEMQLDLLYGNPSQKNINKIERIEPNLSLAKFIVR